MVLTQLTTRRLLCGLALAGVAWLIPGEASAQFGSDGDGWDEPRPVMPTPAEELREHERFAADFRDRRMGGLMREGAHVMSVRGSVHRDADEGAWIARLSLDAPGGQLLERDMRLMPNSYLNEVQHVVRSNPNQRITFELTGELFVYHGRNYLLLRAPARVIDIEVENVEHAEEVAPADGQNDEAAEQAGRSAADVMRELERETGPLHRAAPTEAKRQGRNEAENDQRTLREGALLVQRRGRITRDAGGAWTFVFDADSQGLGDPPLTLMPCLLLERIERYVRHAGPAAPVLISGQVFVYEGRGYLLPSSFELPRERTSVN